MTVADPTIEDRARSAIRTIGVDVIAPAPLPDELARGFKGSLMRFNGIQDEKRANRLLAEASSISQTPRTSGSPIEILASVLGEPRQSFICQHTMLPIRRAIVTDAQIERHGSDTDASWRVPCMLVPDRRGAYFCEECVVEDIHFHGRSYWRRDHQLPGRYCCGKHGTVLRFSTETDAFLLRPSSLLRSATRVRAAWARQTHANKAVQRFLLIQSELLVRPAPLALAGVATLLRDVCDRHGLQYGEAKRARGRFLSDALADTYGADWTATVVGDLGQRTEGRPLQRIDGYIRRLPVAVYLAALAMLYNDAQAALSDLVAAGGVAPHAASRTSNRSDDEELRRLYIRYIGCHRKVASAVDKHSATLARRLDRMGLPSLNGHAVDQLDRQLQAFVQDGASLAQACSNDPQAIRALERLLATAATNLASALRQIVSGGSRGRSRRRPEPPLA